MDEGLSVLFGLAVFVLVLMGAALLFMDFRHFSDIKDQCATQGYVQNERTRIRCSVEPKPKAADAQ